MKWLNDEIFYPALNLHYLLRTAPTNDLQLVLQKEGVEILDKMEAGLKRFDNEKSCHLPKILKEVRTLQKICNEKGAANGNISFLDGANHFLNSDLEGCGKRGIATVTRLTTPPLFPEAGYFEKNSVFKNESAENIKPPEDKTHQHKQEKKKNRSKKLFGNILDSDASLISFLTKHHQYEQDSCLNLNPISCKHLALETKLSKNTASLFFKKKFNGYKNYVKMCRDASQLSCALKMLLGETSSPHILLGEKANQIRSRFNSSNDL